MTASKSRFEIVETADMYPGVDFITGLSKGPFVYTNFQFNRMAPKFAQQNRNHVYLSVKTVKEMARVAGLLNDNEQDLDYMYNLGLADGYEKAIKENFGGNLAAFADRLGGIVDWIRSLIPVEPPAGVDGAQVDGDDLGSGHEGAGHHASDDHGDDDAPGQEPGARVIEGPDDVPGRPGHDDDPFAVR